MEEKHDKKTNKHTECREEIGNPFSPPVSRNAQGRGPTIYRPRMRNLKPSLYLHLGLHPLPADQRNTKSRSVRECSLWTAHVFFRSEVTINAIWNK